MRRIWTWLSTPARWALGSILVTGAVLGILFWGGLHTAMEATNSLSFCTGCHEMRPVFNEYARSPHYQNASGVRAICSDCHVPKPWGPKVIRKIQATNELYHMVAGSIDTPEKFEQKRLQLAKNVWSAMQASDSRECRNCHSFDVMDISSQRDYAQKWHTLAPSEGFTCIDCHKGIAHQLPDVTAHYSDILAELEQGGRNVTRGTVLTLSEKSLVLDPEAVSAGIGNATLPPATELTVLERQDDRLKVTLSGWYRGEDSTTLSARAGDLIPVAALDKAARAALETGAGITDSRTELVWTRGELTGWVSDAGLVTDRQKFTEYAQEMNEVTCSACHHLYKPGDFGPAEWEEVMQEMRHRVSLNDTEYAIVRKYLQITAAGGSL